MKSDAGSLCFRRTWILVALLCLCGPAAAQLEQPLPGELEGVGVTQRLDAEVPLDLTFIDEEGRTVRLQDYFRPDRPVLLSLVYYRCPMLRTLVLDGMVNVLRELDWTPGEEFEVLTVSIDHREGPELAREKKEAYITSYRKPEAAAGWHFLTGEKPDIEALAEAVGFGYQFLEERGEFSHPAVLFVITPDGRVSRYLFGVLHDPRTLRLSLVEAADGGIGSPVDKFLLYCYRYDAEEGRYTPVAWRIMRLGGLLFLLVLGAVLLSFWRLEARHRKKRLA